MAESQGKGLKTPVNGLFHKNFEFEPLFGYDNFQNKIDTWETTVWQVFSGQSGFRDRGCRHGGCSLNPDHAVTYDLWKLSNSQSNASIFVVY